MGILKKFHTILLTFEIFYVSYACNQNNFPTRRKLGDSPRASEHLSASI